MNQDAPINSYFVVPASTIFRWPYTLMKFDPKRVIICGSTISRMKADPLCRKASKELDVVVNNLVSLGATLLGDPNERVRVLVGASILRDRRPEVEDFMRLPENEGKRFFVISSSRFDRVKAPFIKYDGRDFYVSDIYRENTSLMDAFVKLMVSLQQGYLFALTKILFQISIGLFAAVSAPSILKFSVFVVSTYPPAVVWLSALIGGAILFFWRERGRLSYGIFELLIGIATVSNTIDLPKLLDDPFQNVAYLQAAAGFYVTVRGFDNIGKGIERTRFGPYWKRVFEGKPRSA